MKTIITLHLLLLTRIVFAGVGDPQIMTEHPWYPGELAISSFDRLAKTQAKAYRAVTGRSVDTDEDKALARSIPVVIAGERNAVQARTSGFSHVIQADNPGDDAVLEAVLAWGAELPHGNDNATI